MKKIVFIEPASPDVHVFKRYPLPRLGILLMATRLAQMGYETSVQVESLDGLDFEEIFSADLVAISTITSTALRAYELARIVKAEGTPVVMGGPHVTFMPEEALRYADFVLRGEADETFPEFVKRLEKGEDLSSIPGISFRSPHGIVHNPHMPLVRDISSLPDPDFSLLKGREKLPVYPVITSRGCPFDCTFCSVTKVFGHRFRFLPPERVVAHLKQLNQDWIFFYDDNFTASPARAKQILSLMIRENVTPHWTAQVRVDVAKDRELLDLMKESNCYGVYIGFESVNPRTLASYNKKQSLEEIDAAIEALHSRGIKIHGMFVLGGDEDTVETVRETVAFAKSRNLETVQFLVLTPLPGTKTFHELEREGRLLTRAWHLYDGHHVVFKPKRMKPLELQVEVLKAMKKFYSVPQILKSFFKFDFYTFIVRAYARRLVRSWWRRNKNFIKLLSSFPRELSRFLDAQARFVAADLWMRVAKFYKRQRQKLTKKITRQQDPIVLVERRSP